MTNEDLIAAYDAGETITSRRMTRKGSGQEEVVQALFLEILRAMLDDPFDFEGFDAAAPENRDIMLRAYFNAKEEVPAVAEAIAAGTDKHQVQQACLLASRVARVGIDDVLSKTDEAWRVNLTKDAAPT